MLAESILSQTMWDSWFPNANSLYTYSNFMKALGRFPEFCGDTSTNCAIELATISGHMASLSVDLKYTANIACSGT